MDTILFIKTHAIGDVIMATPAFWELRQALPHTTVTLLVGKWSEPIVRNNKNIQERFVVYFVCLGPSFLGLLEKYTTNPFWTGYGLS